MSDSPKEQAMQQTCEKCGTKWTADDFLPCPECPPMSDESKCDCGHGRQGHVGPHLKGCPMSDAKDDVREWCLLWVEDDIGLKDLRAFSAHPNHHAICAYHVVERSRLTAAESEIDAYRSAMIATRNRFSETIAAKDAEIERLKARGTCTECAKVIDARDAEIVDAKEKLRQAFICCGGNDDKFRQHTQDCEQYVERAKLTAATEMCEKLGEQLKIEVEMLRQYTQPLAKSTDALAAFEKWKAGGGA